MADAGWLLNPALITSVGARSSARPVVQVGGARWTVAGVRWDAATGEVVIGLGELMPPVGGPLREGRVP